MAGRNQITKQLLLAATPFPVDSIYTIVAYADLEV